MFSRWRSSVMMSLGVFLQLWLWRKGGLISDLFIIPFGSHYQINTCWCEGCEACARCHSRACRWSSTSGPRICTDKSVKIKSGNLFLMKWLSFLFKANYCSSGNVDKWSYREIGWQYKTRCECFAACCKHAVPYLTCMVALLWLNKLEGVIGFPSNACAGPLWCFKSMIV